MRRLLLDGALGGSVKASDCLWTLESSGTLVATLDKAKHTWWASVVQVRGPAQSAQASQ